MSFELGFRAFGKLPWHADFLQLGGSSPTFARFDDWLTESVEWAHARSGSAWREAFTGPSIRAFVYAPRVEASELPLIIGVLAPSRDEAGRQFPLSIATSLALSKDFLGEPQLLPVCCEGIWQDASQCLAELASGSVTDAGARLAELPAPPELDFADARLTYSEWSAALPVPELWALISASPALDLLRDILRFVSETVRPHRHREPPSTPLSLRLPLGVAGGAAVCFWLDVVRRLIGWRKTVPSFFWSHDGSTGQLTVHLGVPAPSSISELWLPTGTRDEVCDLTAPLSPAAMEHVAPLPAGVEQVLSVPCSVASFLAELGRD